MARRKADGDVSRPNPFSTGNTPPPSRQSPSAPLLLPFDNGALAAAKAELDVYRARVDTLEKQLADEQAGRRADIERIQDKLMRELMEAQKTIARLEAQGKPAAPAE